MLLAATIALSQARAGDHTVDMLADGRMWQSSDPSAWNLSGSQISGATQIFDGAITDPDATTFIISKHVFGGDIVVSMDVTFDVGRYLGVYLDFSRDTQTGIWMATGHALAANAPDNEVERAYIKTVENSFWIVRATGELVVESGETLRLRFVRKGDQYSI